MPLCRAQDSPAQKDDFGFGTSGRSTRLVGGAIRYLQMLDVGLVRKSLREFRVLHRIAPHIVFPIKIVIPLYRNTPFSPFSFRLALLAYRILGGPKGDLLGPSKARELEPNLPEEGLRAALVLNEGQVPFCERLYLDNVIDPKMHGAVAFNHIEVIGLIKSGMRVLGVKARDKLSGDVVEVRGRVVMNATGPWLNKFCGMLERSTARPSEQPKAFTS